LFKNYYQLTKPGIIRGNAVPAIAGFLLASGRYDGRVSLILLLETLIGISLVIAGACVFNNYLDREIDKKMARTKKRALVQGLISTRNALIYATILAILGLAVLAIYTNLLTMALGLLGLFFYVIVYGIAKRRSVHGTLVGSISGALPPVAGYVAVSDRLDASAITLFFILVFWQMPHFYAIATYRLRDYKAAGLPVLPAVKGVTIAKRDILLYTVAFGIAATSLSFFAHTGVYYFLEALLLSLLWFIAGLRGLRTVDNERWARKMFGISLLVLSLLCVGIGLVGLITY
jgi:protoheme IX farnesyltransferase